MKVDQDRIDRSSWDEISFEGWFKALIPPHWEVEDEEDVILYEPDGFGELKVDFLQRINGGRKKETAAQIISDWADELGLSEDYEIAIVKRDRDQLIASAEFTVDEPEGEIEYWRIFAVVGEATALDISYSCSLEDRDREEKVIEGIIDSIRLLAKKRGQS